MNGLATKPHLARDDAERLEKACHAIGRDRLAVPPLGPGAILNGDKTIDDESPTETVFLRGREHLVEVTQ